LAAKVPEDVWPDFKVRAQAAYQAPRSVRPIRCYISPQPWGSHRQFSDVPTSSRTAGTHRELLNRH